MRREKKAWAENRGQGGIPWTDDITAPTARTRFKSVQEALPSLLPWAREKHSAPSTPSADDVGGMSPETKPESNHEAKLDAEATHGTNGVVDGASKDTDSPPSAPNPTDNVPDPTTSGPGNQQTKS